MGWKYIKGTEKAFDKAPKNAIKRIESDKGGSDHLVGWLADGMLIGINGYKENFNGSYGYRNFVTAERVWVEEDKKTNIFNSEPIFLPVEQEKMAWNGSGIPPVGTICQLKIATEFYTQDGKTLFPVGTLVEVGGIVNFKSEYEMVAVKIKGTSCRDAVLPEVLTPF